MDVVTGGPCVYTISALEKMALKMKEKLCVKKILYGMHYSQALFKSHNDSNLQHE